VSIAELCRKAGINQNLYYRWSKEFLEAGKNRLAGDTVRETTSDVSSTLELASKTTDLGQVSVQNRAPLLSDNGPCYVAEELGDWQQTPQQHHFYELVYLSPLFLVTWLLASGIAYV